MPVESFAKIKEILYNSQGNTSVVLHINGTKKLKLPITVNTENNLLNQLKDVIGENNIKIS